MAWVGWTFAVQQACVHAGTRPSNNLCLLPSHHSTAVVYAAELAPPGWEGRHSTFIVAWCQAGLLLGEIVVMLSE